MMIGRIALISLAGIFPLLGACQGVGAGRGEAFSAFSVARLADAQGEPKGRARLTEDGDGLVLRFDGRGLKPGTLAIHIHSVGKCEAPDFSTAGGHWNPTVRAHGANNPAGSHMGDLPNLEVGPDGRVTLETRIEGASLTGEGHRLIDADGAALVIHAGPDDMVTDPAGNSGGRIACGVFGQAEVAE